MTRDVDIEARLHDRRCRLGRGLPLQGPEPDVRARHCTVVAGARAGLLRAGRS